MAYLKFSDSVNTNKLIITWAKFDVPGTEIGRAVYDPPHPERALTVAGLEPVMHTFKFYRSTDGIALQTLILNLSVDLTLAGTEIVIYDYLVGRGGAFDPVAGGSSFTDSRLINKKWKMERRGTGKMRPDEYTINTTTGQWTLGSGQIFEDGDTFFAVIEKTVLVDSITGGDYGVIEITSDVTIGATHYHKLLVANFSTTIGTITIPAGVPKCKMKFNTHGGTQRYLKLAFASPVSFMGSSRSNIYLGKGESLELIFTGTATYVADYEGDYRKVGQHIWGRKAELNTIICDGATYNMADYPRLYNDYINLLPSTQVKSFVDWGLQSTHADGRTEFYNKGFFAITDGQFKVPDLRKRMIRGLALLSSGFESARTMDFPGGFMWDELLAHTHDMPNAPNNASAGNLFYTRGGTPLTPIASGSKGSIENTVRNIGLIPQIII